MLQSAPADATYIQTEDFPSWADRFVLIGEAKKISGYGATSIWEMTRKGEFPRPYKISANRTAWSFQELQEWVAERKHAAQVAA
jgi:prophage regulatory protein